MEEIAYYSAIAAVIAFGLHAGRRWARSTFQAVLLGLAGTMVAVLAFFLLIVGVAILSPASLHPQDMAVRLGALLLFGFALGVVAALGGRRRAVKAATRLF